MLSTLVQYSVLGTDRDSPKHAICMPSKNVTSANAIVDALDETDKWGQEWGGELYQLSVEFDVELRGKWTAARTDEAAAV